jgi:hypothetical protein
MAVLHAINLGARFGLELSALALVSYLAYRAVGGSGWAPAAAIGAPLLLAAAWGTFASPKAAVPVPEPWKVGVEMVLLLLPAAGLVHAGKTGWAGAYGAAVVVNAALLAWWDQ